MELQRFEFEGHPLTVVEVEGRPAWIAREVGEALGYSNGGKGLVALVGREWATELEPEVDVFRCEGEKLDQIKQLGEEYTPSLKHAPSIVLLYESGVHIVCMLSRKPLGRKLRRWLASEVIPQIVRTGGYSGGPIDELEHSLADRTRAARALQASATALKATRGGSREAAALYRRAALLIAPDLAGELGGTQAAQELSQPGGMTDDDQALLVELAEVIGDVGACVAGDWVNRIEASRCPNLMASFKGRPAKYRHWFVARLFRKNEDRAFNARGYTWMPIVTEASTYKGRRPAYELSQLPTA